MSDSSHHTPCDALPHAKREDCGRPAEQITLPLLAILAACILSGCQEYNRYEIDLKPDGSDLQRELWCWRVKPGNSQEQPETTGKFPADELTTIARLYAERLSAEEAPRHHFRGRFAGAMPRDIGGAGTFTLIETPVGSAASYVERFRGNDDLDSQLYDKRQAADRLTDLVIGWLESEIGSQANFAALRQFLHQDFRQDLRNLALYWWLSRLAEGNEDERQKEFGVRVGQYLVERGYFEAAEAPSLLGASLDDSQQQLKFVRRLLARKLRLTDEATARTLNFLADAQQVSASWEKYLSTTPEFKRRLKLWEQQLEKNPDATKPQPMDVLSELVGHSMLELELFYRADELQLVLHLAKGQKPFATNGGWDELLEHVVWTKNLPKPTALPVVCYAAWSVPKADYQKQHFGRVVLEGEKLARYAAWHRTLTVEQRAQWDRFLAALTPQGDLKEKLNEFSFSGPALSPADESGTIEVGRNLILEGLSTD